MITTANETASKASLRMEAIRLRDSISPEIKKIRDKAIQNNLFETAAFIMARLVMFFASIRSEPNTLAMIDAALSMNKTIVLPRVNRKTRALEPYKVADLSELVPGYMDIPEPQPQRSAGVSAGDIDIIVMPGLAFDKTGGRVGYGGGYYDRLLSDIKGQLPVLAAIAYDEQIVERVPVMSYDVKVDMIVTESGVINCKGVAAW
ncbi:MAG: 5-formyltetrahydrofolate cyclo-ligase [Nitrospirae bacterium]|nr:5-formyltetrahydrofolate cyclo-ligase [Nitrospirota bacterium]